MALRKLKSTTNVCMYENNNGSTWNGILLLLKNVTVFIYVSEKKRES